MLVKQEYIILLGTILSHRFIFYFNLTFFSTRKASLKLKISFFKSILAMIDNSKSKLQTNEMKHEEDITKYAKK